MKKNGYTLIEVLGVLIILGVLAVIAYPIINNIISSSKKTIADIQVTNILNAAYDYSLNNPEILPIEENEKEYIILGQLKKVGLIDSQIKQPLDGDTYPDNLVISISNIGKEKVNKKNSFKKGNYLFKIEYEFMSTEDFINKKPTIKFNNYLNNQEIININLGSNYEPLKYNAETHDEKDITDKVVINVYDEFKLISNINTSKIGLYKIHYSVIDDMGYSSISKVVVNVIDLESPQLILPENNIINIEIDKYDLKKDVKCKDNSGVCKINYIYRQITENKYLVTYTSVDPSGNTIEKERVITIEK